MADLEERNRKLKIIIGNDHAGMEMKKEITEYLKSLGYEVINYGVDTAKSCDYPEIGEKVGRAVAADPDSCGVLICGTGAGISIAANKVNGIRAAVCSDTATARLVKQHNNANIIAFGARIVGTELAKDIVKTYLDSVFEGGRHQRRIDMVHAIEKRQNPKCFIQSVFDKSFAAYGQIVEGYDFSGLLSTLEANSEKPADSVIYVPSVDILEATDVVTALQSNYYGGMPIQVGYCNGNNTKLNCLEYHRDSEVDIAADDVILLVAREQDIQNGQIDSSKIEAFLCPKGTGVELYATTLHYAPCNAKKGEGFRVIIILPKGTNEAKPAITPKNQEDRLLWAANKWLLAHKDSAEAKDGAHIGITGENIDISELI